jgi:hypothetical protein
MRQRLTLKDEILEIVTSLLGVAEGFNKLGLTRIRRNANATNS